MSSYEQTRYENERNAILLGKNLIGNHAVAVSDGRIIGIIKDLYLAADLGSVTGIYLGTEGFFGGTHFLISAADIVTWGVDAAPVAHADVIHSRLIERREPSDWRYPLDLVRLGHNSSRS